MTPIMGKGPRGEDGGGERTPDSMEVLVGQLFMVGLDPEARVRDALQVHLAHDYAGVFLRAANLRDLDRARRLSHRFRRRLRNAPPMIVGTDEEGGLVSNTRHLSTTAPSAAALGMVDDEDLTRDVYEGMGQKLRALGFNTVFAPVLDIHSEPANPVIGTRAFGTVPTQVTKHGLAAIEGLHAAGVACCAKHFPGHGAADADSHLTLPVVKADLETLREREIKPFVESLRLETPPEMIMTAHVAYPALDKGTPATLSKSVVQDLLRMEMGYQGVVVSDAMEMKAITDHQAPGKAAIQAILAGVDLLLYPLDVSMADAAYQAVLKAVKAGKISEERIGTAVDRVHRLRNPFRGRSWISQEDAIDTLDYAHEQSFFEAAQKGVALEGNAGVLAEISRATGTKIVVLPRELDEHRPLPLEVVREQLEPAGFTVLDVGARPTGEEIKMAAGRAAEASVVVVGTASRGPMTTENRKLVESLTRGDVIKVGVALLDPHDVEQMMTTNCRIKTFGFSVPQMWALCQTLMD